MRFSNQKGPEGPFFSWKLINKSVDYNVDDN